MQLKGLLYYYFINMRYSLFIFWSIMAGLLILSIGADLIFGSGESIISFDFSAPIYIFAAIMGFWVVKNVIPYMIKMGSTRFNVYVGTGIVFIALTVFNATLANAIRFLITTIHGSGVFSAISITIENNGQESAIPYHLLDFLGTITWSNQFIIDIAISIFALAIMFIVGLVFYRYKLIGGAIALGVIFLLVIYSIAAGWVTDFFLYLLTDISMLLFYQLFFIGVIMYGLSYFLIRRLTI